MCKTLSSKVEHMASFTSFQPERDGREKVVYFTVSASGTQFVLRNIQMGEFRVYV